MSTFCPRCGTSRLPQAQFCAECGYDFAAADNLAVQIAPARFPAEAPTLTSEIAAVEVEDDVAAPVIPVTQLVPELLAAVSREATMARSRRPRRSMVVAAGTAVLAMALLVTAAYGFTTTQTLDRTNSNLATTSDNLATTTDSLSNTQDELDLTKTNLTSERGARSQAEANVTRLTNQVSGLQSQLEARDACVAALKKDEGQLQKISLEQTTNFNLGAKGSSWAKNNDAYISALMEVAADYYNAYSNAWDGSYAAANSWVAAGNSAQSRATQAVKLYNAQITKINAGTKKIDC